MIPRLSSSGCARDRSQHPRKSQQHVRNHGDVVEIVIICACYVDPAAAEGGGEGGERGSGEVGRLLQGRKGGQFDSRPGR